GKGGFIETWQLDGIALIVGLIGGHPFDLAPILSDRKLRRNGCDIRSREHERHLGILDNGTEPWQTVLPPDGIRNGSRNRYQSGTQTGPERADDTEPRWVEEKDSHSRSRPAC